MGQQKKLDGVLRFGLGGNEMGRLGWLCPPPPSPSPYLSPTPPPSPPPPSPPSSSGRRCASAPPSSICFSSSSASGSALKKSLHCKLSAILTRKSGRSGCSRSIANLKYVIHGSKRHLDRPPSCSPRSIGSSEFLNPITHEVILNNSTCKLKITGFGGCDEAAGSVADTGGGSSFLGTLRPGTPGPRGHHTFRSPTTSTTFTKSAAAAGLVFEKEGGYGGGGCVISWSSPFSKPLMESNGSENSISCHKCGEQFGK